jgi:hypothetical protein
MGNCISSIKVHEEEEQKEYNDEYIVTSFGKIPTPIKVITTEG